MTKHESKAPVSLEAALAALEARKSDVLNTPHKPRAELAAYIANQRALQAKVDALPQHERRQVLDDAGMHHVSAAPKPLEAIRGSGHLQRTKTRPARWSVWRLMPAVKLWQAVALSLNIEPAEWLTTDAIRERDEYSRLPADYYDRMMVCKANLSTNGPIRPQGTPYGGMLSDSCCSVLLSDVAGLLVAAGLTVPQEMCAVGSVAGASGKPVPTSQATASEQGKEHLALAGDETTLGDAMAKRARLLARFRELGGKRPQEGRPKGKRGALAALERETTIDDKNLGQLLDKAIEDKRRADAFAVLQRR